MICCYDDFWEFVGILNVGNGIRTFVLLVFVFIFCQEALDVVSYRLFLTLLGVVCSA